MWYRYVPTRRAVQLARDADRARGVEETIPLVDFAQRPGSTQVLRYPWAWVQIEEGFGCTPARLAGA